MRILATAGVIASTLVIACSKNDEDSDFEALSSECTVESTYNATIEASGAKQDIASLSACTIYYRAKERLIRWRIVQPGAGGGYYLPVSAIEVRFHADTPDGTTLKLVPSDRDNVFRIAPDAAVVQYGTATTGGNYLPLAGVGTITIASNRIYGSAAAADTSIDFHGVTFGAIEAGTVPDPPPEGYGTAVKVDGSFSMSGKVDFSSSPPAQSSGGESGSNGGSGSSSGAGSCNQSACDALTARCTGTALAPCYCAAACACKCAGKPCEAQNRSEAAKLGTSCAY